MRRYMRESFNISCDRQLQLQIPSSRDTTNFHASLKTVFYLCDQWALFSIEDALFSVMNILFYFALKELLFLTEDALFFLHYIVCCVLTGAQSKAFPFEDLETSFK